MKGNTQIVKRLITSNADVLKKDEYGETPHMIALRRGNTETAALIDIAQKEVLKKLQAEKAERKSRMSQAALAQS
jgi:ankyrin repeat protein